MATAPSLSRARPPPSSSLSLRLSLVFHANTAGTSRLLGYSQGRMLHHAGVIGVKNWAGGL